MKIEIPSYHETKGKPARLFPKDVRDALIEASKVDRLKGPGESMARTLAVDAAVRRARRSCPGLFINPKEY